MLSVSPSTVTVEEDGEEDHHPATLTLMVEGVRERGMLPSTHRYLNGRIEVSIDSQVALPMGGRQ